MRKTVSMQSINNRVKLWELPSMRWECPACGNKFVSEQSKDLHMANDCAIYSKLPKSPLKPLSLSKEHFKNTIPSIEPNKFPTPKSPIKPLKPNNMHHHSLQMQSPQSSAATQGYVPTSPFFKKDFPFRPPDTAVQSTQSNFPQHQSSGHIYNQDLIQEVIQKQKTKKPSLSGCAGNVDNSSAPVESIYEVFDSGRPAPSNNGPRMNEPQNQEMEIYSNLGPSPDNLRLRQENKELRLKNSNLETENRELRKQLSKNASMIEAFQLENKQLRKEKLENNDFEDRTNKYENSPVLTLPPSSTHKK